MGPLRDSLGLGQPTTVAMAGSGGKTTLLYALAKELARAGQTVVVTTTTRIFPPTLEQAPQTWLIGPAGPEAGELARRLAGGLPLCVAAGTADQGKLIGLSFEQLEGLAGGGRWLLVEADGAARLPLKGWAEHEPVLPPKAELVVVVVGASGLGQPLGKSAVHRPEFFAEQSGLALGQPVRGAALARALLGPHGPLRDLPPNARAVVLVNQVDAAEPGLVEDLREKLIAAAPQLLILGGSLAAGKIEAWNQPR